MHSGVRSHHFNYTYPAQCFPHSTPRGNVDAALGSFFQKRYNAQLLSRIMNTASTFMPNPTRCDPEDGHTKYIGRYLGRPVIATSRVDSYDEDSENMSHFHYNRHEDDQIRSGNHSCHGFYQTPYPAHP